MDFETIKEVLQPLHDAYDASVLRALERWEALPEDDKLDYLQAICRIIVRSERRGTSHRGLMNDLGVYPSGFWVTELMDIHNAMWSEFHVEIEGGWKLKNETEHPTSP